MRCCTSVVVVSLASFLVYVPFPAVNPDTLRKTSASFISRWHLHQLPCIGTRILVCDAKEQRSVCAIAVLCIPRSPFVGTQGKLGPEARWTAGSWQLAEPSFVSATVPGIRQPHGIDAAYLCSRESYV